MSGYFAKMRGGDAGPPHLAWPAIGATFIGAAIAIGTIAWLAQATATPLILGSFGASCVLLFGYPDNPFSQPRNVIGGHVLTSLIGLAVLTLFGVTWWSIGLALATAIAAMQITRTVHPPAGSNPVIVMLNAPGWNFALAPTLLGAVLLVAIALVFNNLRPAVRYPRRWL